MNKKTVEKILKIGKGRQEHLKRTSTFFSMNIYKDSIYFCFYPIAFCTRIYKIQKQKKIEIEIEKGRQEY